MISSPAMHPSWKSRSRGSARKLQLPEPPRAWVEHQLRTWSLQTIGMSREDMCRATELPLHHRDPFDRLLVAAALNHDATLLTPDAAFKAYPASTRW
jgi:PIN domain nuclease of toxin-antitoxin system